MLATNVLAAGWGAVAWLRHEPSVAFWYLLRVAQATVVAEVIVGGIMLARGDRAGDELHVIYGVAPLVITLVSEAMRVGAMQREVSAAGDLESLDRSQEVALARRIVLREMGVMTIGALLIVTLALRAMQSGLS